MNSAMSAIRSNNNRINSDFGTIGSSSSGHFVSDLSQSSSSRDSGVLSGLGSPYSPTAALVSPVGSDSSPHHHQFNHHHHHGRMNYSYAAMQSGGAGLQGSMFGGNHSSLHSNHFSVNNLIYSREGTEV